MTEGQSGLVDRVLRWVETSGNALEMRVARTFARARAASVEPSCVYQDERSKEWREIDVVATFHHQQHRNLRVVATVECKSSTDKPWVVFTDRVPYISDDEARDRHLLLGRDQASAAASWQSVRGCIAVPSKGPGYSIAEAILGAKQPPPSSGPAVPYRAVRQALSAGIHRNRWMPPGIDVNAQFVQLTLPVVVTAAPLFECYLDADGVVQVSDVGHSMVEVQPDSASNWSSPFVVQLMTEAFLTDEWAPAAAEAANLMRFADE